MADFNCRSALAGAAGLTPPIGACANADEPAIVFDALHDIRTANDMALMDQIIASGTRGVAVNVSTAPRRMTVIRRELDRRGMAAVDTDKIMGGNLVRLYREVVG